MEHLQQNAGPAIRVASYHTRCTKKTVGKLRVNILTIKTKTIIVTVDYFSNFFELDILTGTSAMTVKDCLMQQFARIGIPDTL